jgi:hypothetical protein
MAGFDDLYRMQQGQNNPLINLEQMQARMPNWLTAPTPQSGNLGATRLFADVMNRPSDMDLKQQTLDIERQRAKDVADIQMRTFQANLARQGQSNLSKTPTYIRNPETEELQIIQLSSAGQPVTTELPEGYEPIRPITYQDVGGQIMAMPYGSAAPQAAYKKTLAPEAEPATRAAQATAVAQAKTKQAAIEELPMIQDTAERTIGYIDELMAHPGLESGTGWSSLGPALPGTDRLDFETRKEQLTGGAFLQAYQELKGGGQITEIEGLKAEQSIARMKAATKEEDFKTALMDFRAIVEGGLKRAKAKAGTRGGGGWTQKDQAELEALRAKQGGL